MKILLDTNVVLDLLLKKEPFCDDAKSIFEAIEDGYVDGYLSPTSITTIHYLTSKQKGKEKADEVVFKLLKIFNITTVDKIVLIESSLNNGNDFEDSVIYTSALFNDIDFIVTRDKKGFKNSKVEVITPAIMISKLIARGKNV
jgi:predicted nucleic acid-binding protein